MEIQKKVGGGVPFARKEAYEWEKVKFEADIKDGDLVTILNEGVIEPNKYGGESHMFHIKTRNGDKKVGFNQRTLNVLHDELGKDSKDWVNKDVNVILEKTTIAGKRCIVAYFVTGDWKLDDYGELSKLGQSTDKKAASIEYPEEEINPDDIPF